MPNLFAVLLLASPLTWYPVLADPNAAVLLLLIGLLLIYTEINIPGAVIPGAIGLLGTLLAIYSLSLQPINDTALAVLLAALVALLIEVKVHTHGVAAVAGIVALVYGLAHLVDAPDTAPHVHWSTALAAGGTFGVISLVLGWLARLAAQNKYMLGPQAMLGKVAIAKTALNPGGQVEIRGELWQATLEGETGSADKGATLVVRAVNGLRLTVQHSTAEHTTGQLSSAQPAAPAA